MNDDLFRDLAAQNVAHKVLISALLRMLLLKEPEHYREIGEALKRTVGDTSWLGGIAIGNYSSAERLADITVLMQNYLENIVDGAVAAVARTEG